MRKNLQEARKAAGLTQQQMAEKLNITIRYYKAIEYGEKTGSFDIWDKLEELLNVHQKKLRLDTGGNQSKHEDNPQFEPA